jgi:hypothetical protein
LPSFALRQHAAEDVCYTVRIGVTPLILPLDKAFLLREPNSYTIEGAKRRLFEAAHKTVNDDER